MSGIFTVHTEKIRGAGEDAEPYSREFPSEGAIAAVFDGMGGAGGAQWHYGQECASGARLASRIAREALASFVDLIRGEIDSRSDHATLANEFSYVWNRFTSRSLERMFDDVLSEKALLLTSNSPSRIKSKILKLLPTTIASVIYRAKDGVHDIRTLWAGDSRVYYLTATDGLHLLTTDHSRQSASLQHSSGGDAPLTHFLSEATPNRIEQREYSFSEPGVIICATDGIFSYFKSDAHLELALWLAIERNICAGPELAREMLESEVLKVAGDDTSAVIIPLAADWDSHDFKSRIDRLKDNIRDIELIEHEIKNGYPLARPLLFAARSKLIERFKTQNQIAIHDGEKPR